MEKYRVTAEILPWARKRALEMQTGCDAVGEAMESMELALKSLRSGAGSMDNQPESDVVRSYALDIERTLEALRKDLKRWKKDTTELNYGLLDCLHGGAN